MQNFWPACMLSAAKHSLPTDDKLKGWLEQSASEKWPRPIFPVYFPVSERM